MARKPAHRSSNAAIAALAAGQFGVITRAQLLHAGGLGEAGIDARVARRDLCAIHRGIYSIGAEPTSDPARWLAAVWACGDMAALSHRDAAALWSLLPSPTGGEVHVTVPTRAGRRARPGIVIHRCRLEPRETTTRRGIRVTTCARTLIDIAPSLSRRELERAVDEAFFLRQVNLRTMNAALTRNAGRPGSAALRRCLERHEPGTTRTETELEEAMFALCRRHCLPPPECQVWIEGFRVDFFWPDQRLIVETDGWQGHGSRVSFEDDRERDVRLRLAGYRPPLRFTHRQVTRKPGLVAASLRAELRG